MNKEQMMNFATERGMSLEEYKAYLEAAALRVQSAVHQSPDIEVVMDPDVAAYIESEGLGQEVTAQELADFGASSLDAQLHEENAQLHEEEV